MAGRWKASCVRLRAEVGTQGGTGECGAPLGWVLLGPPPVPECVSTVPAAPQNCPGLGGEHTGQPTFYMVFFNIIKAACVITGNLTEVYKKKPEVTRESEHCALWGLSFRPSSFQPFPCTLDRVAESLS